MWISALWIMGGIWTLWAIYCCFLVAPLKEIKRSSWHYKLYDLMWSNYPQYFSSYALCLAITPFALIVAIWFVLCWLVIGCPLRFLLNWVIWPFFFGRKPADGFSKKYWGDLIDTGTLPNDNRTLINCSFWKWLLLPVGGISMKTFVFPSPFVGFVCTVEIIWLAYKLFIGKFASLEIYILSGTAVLMILIRIVAWLKPHLALKKIYIKLRKKFCVKLPVVD